MKVYIGKYKKDYTPYLIAEFVIKTLFFFIPKKTDEDGDIVESDFVNRKTNKLHLFLLYGFTPKNKKETSFSKFLYKYCCNRKRKVKIKTYNYNIYNADQDLSFIILAVLKKFKNTTHSSPCVADCDVPKSLKSVKSESSEYDKNLEDEKFFKRWDYVLDTMIETFILLSKDRQCISEKENNKIEKGLRLFSKYYTQFWD